MKPLRVLLIEDSEFDAHLLISLLRKGGYDPITKRVESATEFMEALQSSRWDIVLADYNLPQFSAPEALELLQESHLDLPFIIVSGGIGESTAVAAMKAGAHDYLMKGNLARLIPAVERELREAENREGKRQAKEALRESELRYRLLWETATDAVVLIDTDRRIQFANPAVQEVFGYAPHELTGQPLTILQPDEFKGFHLEEIQTALNAKMKNVNWRATETVGLRKDGVEIPIELAFSDMELQGKKWYVGFIRDISQRKAAEAELQENQQQFQIARDIQQHLFPKSAPALEGFDIAGASQPAEATGGDYFDYLKMLDGAVGIVVGDVTGHGVGPALLMAETRAYLRVLAANQHDVGEILTQANGVLAEDVGAERFVTLLMVRLQAGLRQVTYANAGHGAGYVIDAAGQIKHTLKRQGIPLGLKRNTVYQSSEELAVAPGDLILLLTDGFEEAIAPDETFFGLERVLDSIRKNIKLSAREIVQDLFADLRAFTKENPQADDLTVVAAKVT